MTLNLLLAGYAGIAGVMIGLIVAGCFVGFGTRLRDAPGPFWMSIVLGFVVASAAFLKLQGY